jgi:hypothetical protein
MGTPLEEKVSELRKDKWEIVQETSAGIQMRRPRQWNSFGVLVFGVIPIAITLFNPGCWFAAMLSAAIPVADYVFQKERVCLVQGDGTTQ